MDLFPVGDTDTTANWVMEGDLTKPRPRSRAALVRAAQLSPSLPEITILVRSSTTVPFHAGDKGVTVDWVMEEHLTKQRPC